MVEKATQPFKIEMSCPRTTLQRVIRRVFQPVLVVLEGRSGITIMTKMLPHLIVQPVCRRCGRWWRQGTMRVVGKQQVEQVVGGWKIKPRLKPAPPGVASV